MSLIRRRAWTKGGNTKEQLEDCPGGIRCVFITQRPALADKTLYTQATEQYLFYLAPSENQYMKNKGIDYNYCIDTWNKLGKYSYIYYDGFNLVGRSSLK